MVGIEGGQYNFFKKKLLPPELMAQAQELQANNIKPQNAQNIEAAEGVQGVSQANANGVQGVGGVQGAQEINPFAPQAPKEDPKAEAKKAEIARITEDAMQELQIDEDSERDLFLNDIKKKMSS